MSTTAPAGPSPVRPTGRERRVSWVRVGGSRIRVERVGSGPPLLMLMGIGGNADMWQPLEEHLGGRELVMFDFPGTGASGMARWPPTMVFNALAVRRLLIRLGLGRVDVLGYSWGGMLAQHFTARYPGSVRRLVLAATTVGLGGVPPSPRVAAAMLTPRRYYSRSYFRRVAPDLYGGRMRTDAALVEAHIAARTGRPPGLTGYACQLAAVTGYSTLPLLPLITAPTLVVAGDDDPVVPTANARLLAAGIGGSRLRVIPGGGHLILLDSPEVVAPLIGDFLGA